MTFLVVIGCLLLGAGSETVMRRIAVTRPLAGVWWYGSWAVAETVLAALFAAEGRWEWAGWMGVCAVINGFMCRKDSRPGGQGAPDSEAAQGAAARSRRCPVSAQCPAGGARNAAQAPAAPRPSRGTSRTDAIVPGAAHIAGTP